MKKTIVSRNKSGFTLIELIVVVGIIGTLTAMSTFAYSSATKNSRDQRRRVDLEQIRSALEMYRSNQTNGNYPSSSLALIAGPTRYGNVMVPNYLASFPVDPLTKLASSYKYEAYPYNCENLSVLCNSYLLIVKLEDGNQYYIRPNYTDGQKSVNTPTPVY